MKIFRSGRFRFGLIFCLRVDSLTSWLAIPRMLPSGSYIRVLGVPVTPRTRPSLRHELKPGKTPINFDPKRCQQPWCRIHIYLQNYWITSLTSFTTHEMHSRRVASSPDHISRAPGSTFSPTSYSTPHRSCNRGRQRSEILPPLPRLTLDSYTSNSPRLLRMRTRKKEVGFRPFQRLCTWRSGYPDQTSMNQIPL